MEELLAIAFKIGHDHGRLGLNRRLPDCLVKSLALSEPPPAKAAASTGASFIKSRS